MTKIKIILILLILLTTTANSQGFGTELVDASAIVEMVSTDKGLLPPRMNQAQRDAITSPATGLVVYVTTVTDSNAKANTFYYYNGTAWVEFGGEITSTGILNAGSITGGFGNIDIGSSSFSTTGLIAGATVTLGVTGATNGIINSPESVYINIDSDASQTGSEFIIGTDRTTNSGGTSLLSVKDNGNVGIGTTSPGTFTDWSVGKILDMGSPTIIHNAIALGVTNTINAQVAGSLMFYNNSNSSSTYNATTSKNIAYISSWVKTPDNNTGNDSGGELAFYTKPEAGISAEAMRIDSNANVGINATIPETKFHVKGGDANGWVSFIDNTSNNSRLNLGSRTSNSGAIQSSRIDTGAQTDLLLQPISGNVGIGIAIPTEKLDVLGNIKASGDVEVSDLSKGIILKSPDGTRYRIKVANGGTLTVTAL